MNRNFINIKVEDYDQAIYRVFSREKFIRLFETGTLTLVRPKLWDDPFENFMLNATGELKDGMKFKNEFRENFYGQCWTTKRESDAMWRIYSSQSDGVKVKTTIRKLYNALYSESGHPKEASCFIGKVEYLSTSKLMKLLDDPIVMRKNLLDATGRGQASTLLLKRIAFSHEKEVRLIYNSQGNINSDVFHFAVNPNDLFDRIVFDPRMNLSVFKADKELIKSWGYKKSIVKSTLYKIPDLAFRM